MLALSIFPLTAAQAHGDLHEAIAQLTTQIAAQSPNAELHLRRGELHRAHREWAAAETDFARAAELAPELAAVDLARGKMLRDAGRHKEAGAALDRYVERQPADPAGYETRAEVRHALREFFPAAKDYARAVSRSREPRPELFLSHAQALQAGGEAECALSVLDQGIARLGPLVTLTLAAVELDKAAGRFDAALARIDRVAARSARKERWLARRAEILEQAGRVEGARAAYQDAQAAMQALPEERRGTASDVELRRKIDAALARPQPPAAGAKIKR